MSEVTDEMRRNMEYISTQLADYESKLRRKEQATMSKIEEERRMMEKFSLRRDFYDKLQANMGPGEEAASAKVGAAEKSVALVQQKLKDLESSKMELEARLGEVLAQNKLDVLPELERLGKLLEASKEEIAISSRAYAADEQRMQELKCLKESMASEERHLQQTIKEREEDLSSLQEMPSVHAQELATVQRDAQSIQNEIDDINQRKKEVQAEIDLRHRRKSESDELKNAETTKLHREQGVLEERRSRVDGYSKQLAESRIFNHNLASKRVEVELHTKKAEDQIRHNSKFLAAENRQLKLGKSALVKKQQSTAKLKASIPQMRSKLKLLQQIVSTIHAEKQAFDKTLFDLKEKVEESYSELFDGQYLEEDVLASLQESAKAVAEREYEIEKSQVEERRANTMLSLMKERRLITQRKIQHVEELKNDASMAIHVQEMQRLDLNKKIKDEQNRARDFSTLHEMIRSEKVECTRLIGETKKALNDMRSRHGDLSEELKLRTVERSAKVKTLEDEIDARRAAQLARANKRTDKSKGWANYQQSLLEVERQEAQVDKSKSSLSNSRKEVERATSQIEQLVGVKQSMAEQLQARRMQLAAALSSSHAYAEKSRQGELSIQRARNELHAIGLKNTDIQRSIDIVKRELENPMDIEEKISRCQKKLETQVLETERLSQELETPSQGGRFQILEGEDPSEEELAAKLKILESTVEKKKEVFLTTEISTKEISLRIRQLENTSSNWKAATQSLQNDINDYHCRVQDRRRLRTAQKSEIQMYDELIAATKKRGAELEQDIMLREQFLAGSGEEGVGRERPSKQAEPASPPPIKRQSYDRPTAYLPDDEAHTINIPKPYGAMAPFAPSKILKTQAPMAETS